MNVKLIFNKAGDVKAMFIKIIGILVGILGLGLFVWHSVKVVMNTDYDTAYSSHQILSLVGGILIIVGTSLYILGRRRRG